MPRPQNETDLQQALENLLNTIDNERDGNAATIQQLQQDLATARGEAGAGVDEAEVLRRIDAAVSDERQAREQAERERDAAIADRATIAQQLASLNARIDAAQAGQ